MKKLGLALVVATSMLVACGGGGDGGSEVAQSNTTAAVDASTVAAIESEAFTFPSGVADFGTTSATTVTLNTPTTFSVTSAQGNASGDLSFGSCIFKVTSSTFGASSPLATGKTVEVQPCNFTVNTQGMVAGQNAVARAVSFILGGNASQSKDLEVRITDSGEVIVEGEDIGTVELSPYTGGFGV